MNCARSTCQHTEGLHDAAGKCWACSTPPCDRLIFQVDVDEEAKRQADETAKFDLSDEITLPERKP